MRQHDAERGRDSPADYRAEERRCTCSTPLDTTTEPGGDQSAERCSRPLGEVDQLPVQQPTKFELFVNLRRLPRRSSSRSREFFLLRADKVIG